MSVCHMVLVKVEGCDPQRTDEIVKACLSQWKRKRHRDEMSRVDKGSSSGPGASLAIFAWVYLPGDALFGGAGDLVDRLAHATWKANGGYCFVDVMANCVHPLDGDHACYGKRNYEELQAAEGKHPDKGRGLAGIARRGRRSRSGSPTSEE